MPKSCLLHIIIQNRSIKFLKKWQNFQTNPKHRVVTPQKRATSKSSLDNLHGTIKSYLNFKWVVVERMRKSQRMWLTIAIFFNKWLKLRTDSVGMKNSWLSERQKRELDNPRNEVQKFYNFTDFRSSERDINWRRKRKRCALISLHALCL